MLLSRKLLAKINENFSNINNNDLTSALNSIGVEVEQIIENKVHPNLKLGKLINVQQHPETEKLSVCEVVVENKKYTIVCGAPNLKNDHWVIVATLDTILGDDFKIQRRTIKGIESEGMLCAIHEIFPNFANLVSEEDKDSIVQIPSNVKLNSDTFFDDFGFNDTIFDLSIPSNRPELNGAYFLAYELNLQFKFTTKLNESKFSLFGLKASNKDFLNIKVNKGLNKYHLAEVDFIYDFGEFFKLKMIYLNSDIKQNNIIDYSSLITILFAQPAVMFGAKMIKNKINIVEIDQDIKMEIPGNKVLQLKRGTIVTKANDEVVSITGMQVSEDYSLTYDDKRAFIEITSYSPDYIFKFKKQNILPNQTNFFNKGPAELVGKIAFEWAINNSWVNTINKSNVVYSNKIKRNKTIFINDYREIFRLLGIKLSLSQLFYIFNRIGIKFLFYKVLVPNYRNDLNNINDLVEEILKYIDINKLEVQPIEFKVNNFKQNQMFDKINDIRHFLINKQFYETKTYNLTSESKLNNFNWFKIQEQINVQNPISNERKFIRNNLVNEMLEVLAYNSQHKQNLLNIFEIQKIQFTHEKTRNILCCLLSQNIFQNHLNKSNIEMDSYTAKAIYDSLEDALGIQLKKEYNTNEFSNVYPVNNFALFDQNNTFVGLVGQLKNNFLKSEFKLKEDVYFICLDLDLALSQIKVKSNFDEVSELNPIYKDVTFYNPSKIDLGNVIDNITQVDLIAEVALKDVFVNKDEEKAYTLTLKIQPENNNLTNDQISTIFNSVIEILRNQQLVIKDGVEQ